MYSVYADGVCIYNDAFALDNMKLASPKLTLEDNAAGSFVMTVPPSNLGYGTIIRMAAADINLYSRTAQGVRVMRVDRDTKVIALARVPKENEEEDAAEEANQAGKEP